MKRIIGISVLALFSIFLLTGTASATVVFDEDTGTGQIDKTDVQRALSWSGAKLQKNKDSITFVYRVVDRYYTEESWWYSRVDHANVFAYRIAAKETSLLTRPELSKTSGRLRHFTLLGSSGGSQSYIPQVGTFEVNPYTGQTYSAPHYVSVVRLEDTQKTLYVSFENKLYSLKR